MRGIPAASIARRSVSGSFGSSSWRPEMLTLTHISSSTRRCSRQVASWVSAVSSTWSPSGADHAGLLGDRDELERRDLGPSGGPPGQRLQPADTSGGEVDDRLVVDLDQRLLDGLAQRRSRAPAESTTRGACLVVDTAQRARAAPLGVVHRDVGVAQQIGRRQPPGALSAMPMLARHEQLWPSSWNASFERLADALCAAGRLLGGGCLVEQDGELVAADPRDRVTGRRTPETSSRRARSGAGRRPRG